MKDLFNLKNNIIFCKKITKLNNNKINCKSHKIMKIYQMTHLKKEKKDKTK